MSSLGLEFMERSGDAASTEVEISVKLEFAAARRFQHCHHMNDVIKTGDWTHGAVGGQRFS